MTKPLISVIIPVFNGERHVGEALDSVFAQDHRPIEVFVVDDGSTDDSEAVIRRFRDARYFYQPNAGVAAARNTALSMARGEIVAFLDQDDQWLPHKLSLQLRHLVDHPDLGFVTARERFMLEDGIDPPPWLRANALQEDPVSYVPGLLLVRWTAFERVGNFDTSYVNGCDTDWIYRAKDAGVQHAVVQETLLLRRVHADNASHQQHLNRGEIFRAVHSSIHRQRAQKAMPHG